MIRYALLFLAALLNIPDLYAQQEQFDVFERTIPELQSAMERGETTSLELVQLYLDRIRAFDQQGPKLNAMLYLNPRALEEAKALDAERSAKGARGPLHGIPMVLKDNYDTFDMPTTASAIALAGFVPSDDAYQVRKLREAGAVFIGKTNLHEFARGIETVSSLGGYTRNPYDPRRNPGGSSGGTAAAIAANFAVVGMGSDTCGSIRIPAANNNLFGIRVTQGLSSRDGIIPLSHTQDVGGPIARSVIDLVTVLDATVGADPADPQTSVATGHVPETYRSFLKMDALKGVRIGLLTGFVRKDSPYGEVSRVFQQAVDFLGENGAEVIELHIDGLDDLLSNSSVIDLEFKFDLELYLGQSDAPVKTLSEVLDSGQYHQALEKRYRRSEAAEANSAKYQERLKNRTTLAQLLGDSMASHNLDALVYPTIRVKPSFLGEGQFGSVCWIAAHSGFPAITVPAGFTGDGLPVGLELLARPFEEGRLLGLAYAYEQTAKPRRPPPRTHSLVNDVNSYRFGLLSAKATGELVFDKPSQTLHYDLRVPDTGDHDILDIKIHRGAADTNGPVIELLGKELKGSVEVSNSDLHDLIAGDLYMMFYTREEPRGLARGQIELLEHPDR